MALVRAALNGKAKALRRIEVGVDVNRPSTNLYSHGTPLHHAVCSGPLDAVKVRVDAGASLSARDTAWNGAPLAWAEYYVSQVRGDRTQLYAPIAAYLRAKGATDS